MGRRLVLTETTTQGRDLCLCVWMEENVYIRVASCIVKDGDTGRRFHNTWEQVAFSRVIATTDSGNSRLPHTRRRNQGGKATEFPYRTPELLN